MTLRMTAAVGLFCISGAGCNLLAPSRLGQQERHRAEPKTDRIQAGELVALAV